MAHPSYPAPPTTDQVDDYHGTTVADPYRWLEALEGDSVRAWTSAQNQVSRPFLDALPARGAIERRLTELWNNERRGAPAKRGSHYFWYHNDGLQNQDVLMVADTVDGAPRALIDPNTWSTDGKAALAGTAVSRDGRLIAYARSEGGTDWRDWRVKEVDTGRDLPDLITFTKFTEISWLPDASGFYYSRHPVDDDYWHLRSAVQIWDVASATPVGPLHEMQAGASSPADGGKRRLLSRVA